MGEKPDPVLTKAIAELRAALLTAWALPEDVGLVFGTDAELTAHDCPIWEGDGACGYCEYADPAKAWWWVHRADKIRAATPEEVSTWGKVALLEGLWTHGQ